MTPIDAIVWTCVAAFISTAIITVLALIGVVKLGGAGADEHRYYLKRLFVVLVLEVVANSLAVFYQQTQTPQASALPSQIVAIQRRINDLEKRQDQPVRGPRWELLRVGSDCSGQDIASTDTDRPEPTNCKNDDVTAVCWDGSLFRNGTRPWCTYKKIRPDQCVGGRAPGRLYRCIPS